MKIENPSVCLPDAIFLSSLFSETSGFFEILRQPVLCAIQSLRCLRDNVTNVFLKKPRNSNFVTGARIAVLLCTETTQKIYRGGAVVDFFSRWRYYNKNYGYPSSSDEGYFFQERWIITIPEHFIEFRGFFPRLAER